MNKQFWNYSMFCSILEGISVDKQDAVNIIVELGGDLTCKSMVEAMSVVTKYIPDNSAFRKCNERKISKTNSQIVSS